MINSRINLFFLIVDPQYHNNTGLLCKHSFKCLIKSVYSYKLISIFLSVLF